MRVRPQLSFDGVDLGILLPKLFYFWWRIRFEPHSLADRQLTPRLDELLQLCQLSAESKTWFLCQTFELLGIEISPISPGWSGLIKGGHSSAVPDRLSVPEALTLSWLHSPSFSGDSTSTSHPKICFVDQLRRTPPLRIVICRQRFLGNLTQLLVNQWSQFVHGLSVIPRESLQNLGNFCQGRPRGSKRMSSVASLT